MRVYSMLVKADRCGFVVAKRTYMHGRSAMPVVPDVTAVAVTSGSSAFSPWSSLEGTLSI